MPVYFCIGIINTLNFCIDSSGLILLFFNLLEFAPIMLARGLAFYKLFRQHRHILLANTASLNYYYYNILPQVTEGATPLRVFYAAIPYLPLPVCETINTDVRMFTNT